MSDGGGSVGHNTTQLHGTGTGLPQWEAVGREVPNPREDGGDDASIYSFGHRAGPTERKAITSLVERYYLAAAAGDGRTACSLLTATSAQAVPREYVQSTTQAYLRGSRTCETVASKIFHRFHGELAGGIQVTGVRVMLLEGFVLLKSIRLKFAYTKVQREGGHWRVVKLLGARLP